MRLSLHYILARTIQDMRRNLLPDVATIGVITISVLIFSVFSLIAFNLASFLKIWEDKIEVIAYLKRKTPASEVETLSNNIRQMGGVESVKYISSSDAMAFMEARLGGQKNLPGRNSANRAPPSLEVQLRKEYRNAMRIGEVVSQLKQLPQIEEIQYGQEWVEMFSSLVHILRITQWFLGGLLLVAMAFIISNTLQLTISSRQEEIEIMQLVGASPSFCPDPLLRRGYDPGFSRCRIGPLNSLCVTKDRSSLSPPLHERLVHKDPDPFFTSQHPSGDHRGGNGSWFSWQFYGLNEVPQIQGVSPL